MFYGETKFIWYRVVAQIVAVQLFYWFLIAGVTVLLDIIFSVTPESLPWQLFDWRHFHLDTIRGYATVIGFSIAAVLS